MSNRKRLHRMMLSLYRYIVFFLLVAFIITCCMMLFVSTLMVTTDISFTQQNLGAAAKLTFFNVVLLSLIITVIDSIRRKIMVDRPVKRITQAAQKMIQGDFSVRIKPIKTLNTEDKFNEIIECLNKMASELSSTETLRTDFISNVSHELKTPLTVIQNYGTMLTTPGLSEDKRIEYSSAIINSSKKLSDLISNILRLNKLENQQIFPNIQSYDLGEQLCECLLSFEELIDSKALTVETDIQDEVMVNTDKEMMSIVWNNLFSNAIKFTPESGKLSLRLKTQGNNAVVSISDTGCGISPDVGEHIFDKFYQGDTSHTTQGNGLGLALVKRIIDITKSYICVESEIGKGSTFTVKIYRGNNEDF